MSEAERLVKLWRKQADTHENYRRHLSDPCGDIGHVHEVKAKRLRQCADELAAALAAPPAPPSDYSRNGISLGERVCVVDAPRVFGTVFRCSNECVSVRWDDDSVGHLMWREDVGPNAFRLQTVRRLAPAAAAPAPVEPPATPTPARCEPDEHEWKHDVLSGDWCMHCFVSRRTIDPAYAARLAPTREPRP